MGCQLRQRPIPRSSRRRSPAGASDHVHARAATPPQAHDETAGTATTKTKKQPPPSGTEETDSRAATQLRGASNHRMDLRTRHASVPALLVPPPAREASKGHESDQGDDEPDPEAPNDHQDDPDDDDDPAQRDSTCGPVPTLPCSHVPSFFRLLYAGRSRRPTPPTQGPLSALAGHAERRLIASPMCQRGLPDARWTLATSATGLLDASSFTNAAAPNMANTEAKESTTAATPAPEGNVSSAPGNARQ
jgi:hypothetical protein